MQRLKVCFVTEDFYPQFIGGQGVYGYHLVKNLVRLGHQVTVLAEKKGSRNNFWRDHKNIKLTEVPYCFGNQLMLAVLEYITFILKFRKEEFDIVHANQLSGLFFVLFKPQNVGKVVVSEWNTHFDMYQQTKSLVKRIVYLPLIILERILYTLADSIIFDSPKEQHNFANFLKLNQPQAAIYLGSNKVKFTNSRRNLARAFLRKSLNLPQSVKIVLYIGRLVERKRVGTLIEALSYIRGSGVYGIIVGSGPELNNLKFKIKNLKLRNIKFVGWTYEPREYYLASDCFVTVSEAEGGFLLTALEAASFGLPLILSPSAAGFPIIKEGKNGFIVIVEPNHPKDLAYKIKYVLERSDKMGAESKKIAKQFSWERCARETLNFYSQTLADRPKFG